MSDLSIPDPTPYVPPLDIQHDTDPAHEEHARRIPHMGHAAIFFGMAVIFFFACSAVAAVIILMHNPHAMSNGQKGLTSSDLHTAALAQLASYALTFLVAIPVFPLMWDKSFGEGISWTQRAAKLRWWKLVLLGASMSVLAGFAEHFVHLPKEIELQKLFDTTASAWVTVISAAIIGPLVEEVAFRGFLLPALATAYDWLTLERTPAAVQRWRETTSHTMVAWIASSIITSLAFAGMHAPQIHHAMGVLLILFCVSIVLCVVRIRFKSVAASALVHMSYNGALMIIPIIQTGGFRHLEKLSQ